MEWYVRVLVSYTPFRFCQYRNAAAWDKIYAIVSDSNRIRVIIIFIYDLPAVYHIFFYDVFPVVSCYNNVVSDCFF